MNTELKEKIETIIQSNPVVLFMKGDLKFPQCGFSARAIQILTTAGVSPDQIKTIDVLSDPEIREGIKEYSQWPTIPQCYIRGEFLGGSDILLEMYESGELKAKVSDL